jgi:two-component system osmolarity sensor histidine kinase EnvZ
VAGLNRLTLPGEQGAETRSRPTRAIKRYLPKTLFGRALIIIVTPVVLLQLIATYIFYERHWDHVTRRLAQGLGGDISMVIHLLEAFPAPERRAFVLAEARALMRLDVTLETGARLPASAPPFGFGLRDRTIAETLKNSVRYPLQLDTASSDVWIAVAVQLDEGVLRVTAPRARIESSSTYIFIMWMVGTALVLVVIAILFMRNQLRPPSGRGRRQSGKGS